MIKRFKASFNQYFMFYKPDCVFGVNNRRNALELSERKSYETRIMKEIDVKEGEMDAVRIVCKNWRLD